MANPSTKDWAANTRSNGSRCLASSVPALIACMELMANSTARNVLRWSWYPSMTIRASGSRPNLNLIATSQADAADTTIVFWDSSMISVAACDSLSSSTKVYKSAWVSSNTFIAIVQALPGVGAQKTHQKFCLAQIPTGAFLCH